MTTDREHLTKWISGDFHSRHEFHYAFSHIACRDELISLREEIEVMVASTYVPHGHPLSDIVGLVSALAGKSDQGHTHDYEDLTGKPVLFDGDYESLSNLPVLFSGDYNDLDNKPILFDGDYESLSNKPSIPAAQVNVDWDATSGVSEILNKPSTMPPDAHGHIIADVTGLQATLDGKIPKSPKASARANVTTGTSGLSVTVLGISVISAAALTRLDEYGAAINDILARLRSREIIET